MTTTDPTPAPPVPLESLVAALTPREKTALALAIAENMLTTALEAAVATLEARRAAQAEEVSTEARRTP
jgi:hypothetical protein